VLAEELTQEAILDALRKSQVYVKFELSSRQDLHGFSWVGFEHTADYLRMVGLERDYLHPPVRLQWIKDGELLNGGGMAFNATGAPPGFFWYSLGGLGDSGVYRLELRWTSSDSADGEPWVFTNHTRFR